MIIRQADINMVRSTVTNHLGNKVIIKANKGRHKIDVAEGVIKETYPCIFTIEVDGSPEEGSRILSFSYTDVLTKAVMMTLC